MWNHIFLGLYTLAQFVAMLAKLGVGEISIIIKCTITNLRKHRKLKELRIGNISASFVNRGVEAVEACSST